MSAVCCAAPDALALTDTSSTLDVGSGESVTLDGTREYTSHVNVHDGGIVYVGASGLLTLRTPTVNVTNGGHISATGKGTSGVGGTLVIDCDSLGMSGSGSSIEAAGTPGSVSDHYGKNGGAITVRVGRTATFDAGVVSTQGGSGYSNTSGDGGDGGSIEIRACTLHLNGTGTRVNASGGTASDTDDEMGGDGGAGGSITLTGGYLIRSADISVRGGNGGDAGEHGGDGGDGGVARAQWATVTEGGAVDVSAGAAGYGEYVSGTPGAAGSWTNARSVYVPYDREHAVLNGSIDDEFSLSNEYYSASRWSDSVGGRQIRMFFEEDGSNLHIALRDYSLVDADWTSNVIFVDTNGDGGSVPGTDDYAFVLPAFGSPLEYRGTGSGWVGVTPSGWSVLRGLRYSPWLLAETEIALPYGLLGITAGQAKTMRVAIATGYDLPPSGMAGMWPSGATSGNPSTWPQMSSPDLWTAFQNVAPGASPGQWTNAQPAAWTSDNTPDCTIQVQDSIAGLDVSTAQYRYSTNSGSTWSSWLTASCSGADGTQALQTLTASSVPLGSSGSANKVQFRVMDVGGLTGTSGICNIMVDASAPSGWTSFSPSAVVTNTVEPDCSIRVQDTVGGLDVDSAQYQYSTNGGSSWSTWTAATCTGASGTTALETLTAHAVPFLRNSTSQNRIRFRVSNRAGSPSTSASYLVQIAAPLTGLPANGNFEVGLSGRVPSLWSASALNYVPGYTSGATYWAYHAGATTAERYEGAQALSAGILAQTNGAPKYNGGITQVTALGPGDFTGTTQVELYMRDIDVGVVDPTGAVSNTECYVALTFSDGIAAPAQTNLYRYASGVSTDSRVGTVTGADGQSWGRYLVTIPAQFDKGRLSVGVKWQVLGGFDVGYVFGVTDVHANSVVDYVHAVDGVAPVSSASVSGASWSTANTRNVSYTAADNAALDSVELWSRVDAGAGFGSWTLADTRSVVGTTSAGTFSVSTPVDGHYEFYTRARDVAGTYELAPGSADAVCGVDTTPPGGNVNFAPSGWSNTRSPSCSVDVRDTAAGIGATPMLVDSQPDESTTARSLRIGAHLYTADKNTVGVFDLANPASPSRLAAAGVADTVTDLAEDDAGEWLFAGLGTTGLVPVSLAYPAAPRPGTVVGHLGDVRSLDAGTAHGDPIVVTGDRDGGVLTVLDASQPSKGLQVVGTLDMDAGITAVGWDGGRLVYVGLASGTVGVVDVSEPWSPVLVDELDAGGPVDALDVSGDRLAVCAGGSLVSFWVAKGPGKIDSLGDTALGDSASDVRVIGNRAYVSLPGSEHVISLPPDASPALLRTLDAGAGGITRASEVNGAYLYTHNDDAGLRAWLLAEPAYQCSSDGGTTWSEWFGAACSVAEGSDATATLTAPETSFSADSATDNLIRFRYADVLGNSTVGAAQTARIDTAAPSLASLTSSTHPTAANWYSATTCSAEWSAASDLSGVVGYSVAWDDSPSTIPAESVGTTALSASHSGASEGVHYAHVRAVDTAGNWGPAMHLAYRVDTQSPAAPGGMSASPTASKVNSFSVSWTAPTQAYAPIDGCYYKLDSPPASATDGIFISGTGSAISGLAASGEGTHPVYVWLRDAAGNASEANRASTTFVYDGSPACAPVISSSTHPVQSAWYSSSSASLSWVSTDSVSAVTGYSWALDASPGTVPDTVMDSTAAATSILLPGDGTWYFHVRAVNSVGLWSATSTFALHCDTSAPTGVMMLGGGSSLTAEATVTVGSVMSDASPMTMRVSVDGGGTWGAWLSYSASTIATLTGGDGLKTVVVEYADSAGHSATRTDTIVLDRTAPVLAMSAAAKYLGSATIHASAVDIVSGVQVLQMRADNGPWVSTSSLNVAAAGVHRVCARAIDAAGNSRTRVLVFVVVAGPEVVELSTPRVMGDANARTGTQLKGYVLPKHQCRVLVDVQVLEKTQYKKYKTFSATCRSTGQWTYQAKLKKGTYRIRALTLADARYPAAASGWCTVKVK